MSIRDDFQPYLDGNGLMAPGPQIQPAESKGSDNGPMYLAEFYDILQKNNQIREQDKTDFEQKIGQCIWPQGILCRVPTNQTDSQEQVDDYYGTLSGSKILGNTKIPRQFLWAMIKYQGFMDSTNPGQRWNWNAWMLRQPQLVACMVSAAFPSWENSFHTFLRLLVFPFYLYAAIVISLSCIGTDIGNTDARRLAWHLIQATAPTSILCDLASKIWYSRLYSDYPNGMCDVAAQYYQPKNTNPYAKYWITK